MKRPMPEQVVAKLRQADVGPGKGHLKCPRSATAARQEQAAPATEERDLHGRRDGFQFRPS